MATILVTGSSTGIGRATALDFARAGHRVVATMRRPDAALDIAAIAEREKLALTVLPLDVTSDASVAGAFAAATTACGAIDVLVNNAGIGRGYAIEDASIDDFKATMETNFFGALRCIKTVLPAMRERRSGCIVNITSVAGRMASSPQGAYASSKFALEALSEVLAQEVRPFGIRVAIIQPGVIATPIFDKVPDAAPSVYPGARRMRALFVASLTMMQVPPTVVAAKIREIVESDTLVLRHPVGPDAAALIASRTSVSDEEWIARAAVDDETWAEGIRRGLGIDVRPYLDKPLRGIVQGV